VLKFAPYAKTEVLAVSIVLIVVIAAVLTTGMVIDVLSAGVVAVLGLPLPIFLLSFFRDPSRRADREPIPPDQMLAPADGKITDITEVDHPRLGGKAVKIGIFLSVFNVHINRSPCKATVADVQYTPGKFLNALRAASAEQNESNELLLEPKQAVATGLPRQIIVRQIAGVLARRIVCDTKVGEILDSGQRFGMIKFGSRTELIVPKRDNLKIIARVGQKVKAGSDVLVQWTADRASGG
jgi:phosphatidylserine decarboxylase